MFLKGSKIIKIIFLIFFFNNISLADEIIINKSVKYFNDLKFFSASFIQIDDNSLSEGVIYIGSKRIRVEYTKPSKILIILDEDKAMYYNYDLEEDEFFDPRKTSAWFIDDVFNNNNFFLNSNVTENTDNIVLEKTVVNEEIEYEIKIIFENNPFILRKINILGDNFLLNLSFYNHKYNESFDEKFFKLINPSLIN